MSVSRYLEFTPVLGERVYISEGAKVIGRAILGDHVNIWFNTVVRADVHEIRIGKNTNVQDLCMLHVTELNGLTIGENTSMGHSVVLHGCKIGNGCLIGMGAIILDGAEIGDNCLVAAGSLVSPGKKFPPGSMIKGRPAVVERPLTPEEIQRVSNHYVAYIGYKEQYLTMEEEDSKKKVLAPKPKGLVTRVKEHNLILLASSISYYAVLGLAPLLLILLAIASLIGENIQKEILGQINLIAPEAKSALVMVFKNLKSRVDLGSISGIFGLGFLLFIASLLFTQLRYSFDVIYGDYNPHEKMSLWQFLKERCKLMFVVIAMCGLFGASLLINPLFKFVLAYRYQHASLQLIIQNVLNFSILFILFLGLYFFTPTQRKKLKDCAKMSLVTSLTFMFGNMLTGLYMKNFAMDSLYGAAGGLLIFLLWAFYSALMIFASVELFEFTRDQKKMIRQHRMHS